jgi:hypothetical protein
MPSTSSRNVRLAAAGLAVAGVLFVLYPALRPWSDESSLAGAEAMASTAWIAAHLFGVFGFVLLALGLLGLYLRLSGTRARRGALRAAVASWIGATLTVLYFGAEIFGLHAIGQRAAREQELTPFLDQVKAVRYNAAALTLFGIGLLLLAVGTVVAAVAVWRSGALPRWSGVLMAAGFALYIPQFFGPPAVRIGHGVLVGAGCAWLALSMWRNP